VSGRVEPFDGLSELTYPELHTIASIGNTIIPLPVTCSDIANDGAGSGAVNLVRSMLLLR
jgi:hypothetical protein